MKRLSVRRLREVLKYVPTTGVFRWRCAQGPNAHKGRLAHMRVSRLDNNDEFCANDLETNTSLQGALLEMVRKGEL